MLLGTVCPCRLAGCYDLICSLGTVEIGYVFGVKVDSMGFALTLNVHGKECGKVNGSVEWKEKEEEHQLEHKRAHSLEDPKANLENFKCLQ